MVENQLSLFFKKVSCQDTEVALSEVFQWPSRGFKIFSKIYPTKSDAINYSINSFEATRSIYVSATPA